MALQLRTPCSAIKASLYIPVQAFVAPNPPLTLAILPRYEHYFTEGLKGGEGKQKTWVRISSY